MVPYCRISIMCLTLLMAAIPQWAVPAPVPDTGQTKCYDNDKSIACPSPGQAFYGQDANYSINIPSYTKLNSNGAALPDSAVTWKMVKDNVTGLIWESKTNKDGKPNYDDPHDADNMYTWYDSNAATNGGNAGTPGDGTDTEDIIKVLNDAKFGGFDDWRLPTIEELSIIVNYGVSNPSIDTVYFPNTVSYYYWSSTTEIHDAGHAWGVCFSFSHDDVIGKSYSYYVRAVRSGQSVSSNYSAHGSFDAVDGKSVDDVSTAGGSYTDNGDGTVTDKVTGLMWAKSGSADKTWEQALSYCEGLNLGGHTDWRLPTIKELRSLVDYSVEKPAINTTYFPNTASESYWSSTPDTDTISNSGTGTMTWTAAVASGGDWLRITSGTSGTNAGTITCAFDANTGTSSRTTAIRVTAAGVNCSPVDVMVNQLSAVTPTPTPTPAPILSVSPTSKSVQKEAGTFPITVSNTGTGAMSWTAAVISGSTWVSINSGSSGTNTGTITCAFQSNTNLYPRTGSIRITADGASGSPNYVTVIQAGTSNTALSPIPDTGQTKCYNVAGNVIVCPSPGQALYGQDANYVINPMSYTKLDDNGNALPDSATSWVMVRDNVTGLIWEMKTNFDWTPNYNDLHDADNEYTWYDSNPATNGGVSGNPGDGINTEEFIKALNQAHYGGYSDWRLPTFKELTYIVKFGVPSPGPTIDANYFSNTPEEFYWSSTTNANYPENAWGVNFYYGGYDANHDKYYDEHVRAVRGGQSGSSSQSAIGSCDAGEYMDNGDNSTVTDTYTGLIWQQIGSSTRMTWEQALAYCEGLDLGGYTDWRMPTIKELRRLADFSRYNPAIDTTNFPNTISTVYWSSTTYENSLNGAWGIDFYNGHDDSYDKDEISYYVRAVRGGNPASLSLLVVSPLSRSVTSAAGTAIFSVSNTGAGTMPWTAAVTTGSGWMRITSGAAGTDAGTIVCAFDANVMTVSRTGIVRIIAAGAIDSPIDVTVNQTSAPMPTPTPTPKPTPTPTRNQFLGVWTDGVWAWDKITNKWTKMASTADVQMIAAGKVDTDSVDDLIGVWSSGLYVRQSANGQWLKLSSTLPTWIAAGDLNDDGRDDVIGSWKNDGVYYRDSATGKWTKLSTSARQLAVGNIGGTRDDLAGVWNDGLWVRYSADASWKKIDAAIPIWIAAGDMSGDKRADIIGSYTTGTWYRNSATGAWTKITTPAEQLASGDLDGDGRDDLIGIWSNSVYVQYGATGQWQRISANKPKWIATGRMAEAIQAAGSLDDPGEGMVGGDLSSEGPDDSVSDFSLLYDRSKNDPIE